MVTDHFGMSLFFLFSDVHFEALLFEGIELNLSKKKGVSGHVDSPLFFIH